MQEAEYCRKSNWKILQLVRDKLPLRWRVCIHICTYIYLYSLYIKFAYTVFMAAGDACSGNKYCVCWRDSAQYMFLHTGKWVAQKQTHLPDGLSCCTTYYCLLHTTTLVHISTIISALRKSLRVCFLSPSRTAICLRYANFQHVRLPTLLTLHFCFAVSQRLLVM